MQAPRLFAGKVHHIHAASLIDVMVHTDFDVSFTHRCILFGVPKIDDKDSREFKDAKQCAIILIGGRDVIIETVPVPKRANSVSVILYLKGLVPPSDCNVAIDEVDYINVNRYLTWLSERDLAYDRTLASRHKRGLSCEGGDKDRNNTQEEDRGIHPHRNKPRGRVG